METKPTSLTWVDPEVLLAGPGNVAVRSCWNCNESHEHMKGWDDVILWCFECDGRYHAGEEVWFWFTETDGGENGSDTGATE